MTRKTVTKRLKAKASAELERRAKEHKEAEAKLRVERAEERARYWQKVNEENGRRAEMKDLINGMTGWCEGYNEREAALRKERFDQQGVWLEQKSKEFKEAEAKRQQDWADQCKRNREEDDQRSKAYAETQAAREAALPYEDEQYKISPYSRIITVSHRRDSGTNCDIEKFPADQLYECYLKYSNIPSKRRPGSMVQVYMWLAESPAKGFFIMTPPRSIRLSAVAVDPTWLATGFFHIFVKAIIPEAMEEICVINRDQLAINYATVYDAFPNLKEIRIISDNHRMTVAEAKAIVKHQSLKKITCGKMDPEAFPILKRATISRGMGWNWYDMRDDSWYYDLLQVVDNVTKTPVSKFIISALAQAKRKNNKPPICMLSGELLGRLIPALLHVDTFEDENKNTLSMYVDYIPYVLTV